MLAPALRDYLQAHRAEHLDQLKTLLRFPSVSAQDAHHADCLSCAEWIARQLRQSGLQAELDTTPAKPVVLGFSEQRGDRPTLLVYGHYDVQPPDPLELWQSPPFEPTEREGELVARGASDDKGQFFTWIKAAEAFRSVTGDFPVNLKFLIEGEEEIGSPTLEPFVRDHAGRLAADHIAISDTNFYDQDTPSVCYGLRGLLYVELSVTGPRMDLHSGLYGGAVANPIHALADLLAGMHDQRGRVTLPGFYDAVRPLSEHERRAWDALGFSDGRLMDELGVNALTGEQGYGTLERLWARPTLEVNGIWGGYTGQGPKTVLPGWAKAKLSTRLVPDQDPRHVLEALRQYLRQHCPPGVRTDLHVLSADVPWLMPYDAPALDAACAAMEEAFQRPCTRIRGGGSVPITGMFQRHLGIDPLMMGFGLAEDRVHSPNEKFRIEFFHRGILAAAALMNNLAASAPPGR